MEFTHLRNGEGRVVPEFSLLHEIREGHVLRWRVARSAPPESSKQEKVRYLNIHEEDDFDEERFMDWVKQASELPGEKL